MHPPTKDRDCTSMCHSDTKVRSSKFPKNHPLVTVDLGTKPNETCLSCHDDWSTKHKKKFTHSAIEQMTCLGCHSPHGSDSPRMLRTPVNEGELCLTCHSDKDNWKTDSKIKEHKIIHQKKGCVNCHDPHSSNIKSLLLREGNKLCLECHNQGVKTADGRTLKAFSQELAKGRTIHPPVEDDCQGCHQPHSSTFKKLLKDEFGDNYSEFSEKQFGLCFTCHSSELVTVAKTSSATEFRNGEFNLHNFHVAGTPKNRGCGTCHEVHSSKNPRLIKDHMPYKDYRLPQVYEKTADGGSCVTACHGLKVYDRKKPFTNSKGR